MSQARPLEGLRVLDLTRLLPGPFLTVLLADLGAEVIKVEPPDGGDWVRWLPPRVGGHSWPFFALNRGKRSLGLDLKHPEGVACLRRLCGSADVLVEQFRPGVMDRLGVGWETLHAEHPRLVYVALSGYGQTGPYRDRAGHDLTYGALAGTLGRTGPAGGAPVQPGFQPADLSGALMGAVGLLSSVLGARTTGEGRFVDVSLTEAALVLNVLQLSEHLGHGKPVPRGTDLLGGGAPYYGVYACADGRYVALAALEPKFFHRLCDAVGRADWKPRQMGDTTALRAEIAALFLAKDRDTWVQELAPADCCVEPVLELDEVATHPLHIARGMLYETPYATEAGPARQLRTPLADATAVAAAAPPPTLGQHSRQVLVEAGYTDAAIDALIQSRAVIAA